ncbi:secreted protein containing PKD domain protein [Candidatus Magnetomorum sp. HK-1]|nr:secreted protein containing PKD domain protein [Candidatus Magnetomorum sp. HK-1]
MNKIKNLVCFVVVGLFCFTGVTEAEVIEIGSKVISSGSQESFSITINNSPNVLKSFGFDIKFCPDVLSYDSYQEGQLIKNNYSFFMVKKLETQPLIRVGMASGKNKQIDAGSIGELLKLTFTALNPGSCEISIINKVDDIKNWSVKNGWFHSTSPPVANSDSYTIDEDTVHTGTLKATNPNNLTLTYKIIAPPSKGTLTITNALSGSYIYTPFQNETGPDFFQFVVNDGKVDSVPATVDILISAINDPPTISSISDQFVYESISLPITCNVLDPDDASSKIIVSVTSSNDRIIPNDSQHIIVKGSGVERTILVTPADKSFGKTILTVKASDPQEIFFETRFTVFSEHNTYTVFTKAYTNGTIGPIGNQSVNQDEDLECKIKPDQGYDIDTMWIDGERLWNPVPMYTFWKVSANHTLTATFKVAESYTISTAAVPSEAGSLTPSNVILTKRKNQLVKIKTNPGYSLDDVLIDGISQGPLSYYVFSDISQSHHITANYSVALTPVADFSTSYTNGSVPFQVDFSDNSLNKINSWNWNFGDGGKSKNANPVHTYISPGSYSVTLTVAGPGGSSTMVKQNYITIDQSCKPSMDFSVDNRIINKGSSVLLTPTSIGSYSSMVWDFGDGFTETTNTPSHTYSEAGYYTVTLTTDFNSCSETKTKLNFIVVNGRTISGQVQPAISGCLIELWNNSTLIASTTTDQTGNYQIADLPVRAGFIMSIRPPAGNNSYIGQYYDGTTNGVEKPERASKISTITSDIIIDFNLRAIPNIGICGTVKDQNDNGIPFTGITVYSDTGSLAKGVADQNGNYTITNLISANNYIVYAWSDTYQREFYYSIPSGQTPGSYKPAYSVFAKETATQITPSNPYIQNIDIIVRSESINGRVLTESNIPVASAKVNAWSEGLKTGNFTLSDENGYYTITGLTPLKKTDDYFNLGYVVEVLKTIYPYQAYDIASNRETAIRVFTNISGVDFRLKESSTISGSIKDKYLTPIPYASVCATPLLKGVERCTESDLSGNYSISKLYFQDDYLVYAYTSTFPVQYYNQTPDYDSAATIKLQPSGITGIDFIFDEGAIIQGEIAIEGNNTITSDLYVNLSSKIAGVDKYVKADANGVFKFIQLDYNVQDYVISISTDGYLQAIYNSAATVSTWAEAETVEPSATINRNITLSKGAIIKGTITHLGEPVGDVLVDVYSNQTLMGSTFSTTYLLHGYNYEISGLPSNKSYEIIVTHDTLIAQPQTVTVVTEEIIDFDLNEPDFTISGKITGVPKGKKIQLTAWSLSNQTKTMSLVGTGSILDYTIYKLKPDPNYYVDVICQGYPYQIYNGKNKVSTADVIDLSTASSNNIDFTLVKQSGQISGNIEYPEGALSGETVFISAFSSVDSELFEVSTVLDVNCTLPNGCPVPYIIDGINPSNTYYMLLSSDMYKSYYYNGTIDGAIKLSDAVKVDATSNQSIDYSLSKGLSISGSVVDVSGAPVSGIEVETWSSTLESLGKATTDKNGLFSIYGLLQTDDYIVYAIKTGIAPYYYSDQATVRNISSAKNINPAYNNNIVITFDPGETIKGVVYDADGKRLSGIWVRAESKSKHIQTGVFSLNDGTYQILNLPASNDYLISAQPIHTYMPASKTNVSSATENINFYLDKGYTLSGTILDGSNNKLSDIEVSLWSKTLSYSTFVRSDSSGNYQITGIPEASDILFYVASVGQDSFVSLKEEGFSISSDITKNIVLKKGFSISGYVYTDQNESIPYAKGSRITAFSSSMSFFEDTTSDINGFYKISNLPEASDYLLEIFPSSNYANQIKNYQLAGSVVNFVLDAGGTIKGSVINSLGDIMSGATVEISSETANIFESTTTDRNGDYAIDGLKNTQQNNTITDYLIFIYADGYPPHSSVGKSVGDIVNFTLSSGAANMITGVVMDSSGALPPSDFSVLVRTFFQDSYINAVKPVKADENGVYTVTGLDSNKTYRFLFKAYQGSTKVFDQWSDANENGVTDIGSARAYATDESVRFKFNSVWGTP